MSPRFPSCAALAALAACVEPTVAHDPDAGASAAVAELNLSAGTPTSEDRCQVVDIECDHSVITCTGVPLDRFVVTHDAAFVSADASGTATFEVPTRWSGRYVTRVCPAQVVPDGGVAQGCEIEIDEITIPSRCGLQPWVADLDVAVPSNGPLGVTSRMRLTTPKHTGLALVDVDVLHAAPDDLTVRLTTPDGNARMLHEGGIGPKPHLFRRYVVNAGTHFSRNWTLRVTDGPGASTGTLREWQIRPFTTCVSGNACEAGLGEYCRTSARRTVERELAPLGPVDFTLNVDRGGQGTVRVWVGLYHTDAEKLQIDLVSPDGRRARLWTGAGRGWSEVFTPRWFEVDHLAGVSRHGTWALRVQNWGLEGGPGYLVDWALETMPICF